MNLKLNLFFAELFVFFEMALFKLVEPLEATLKVMAFPDFVDD